MSKLLTFHMNPLAKLSQLDMIALKKVLFQDRLLSMHPVVEVTITRLKISNNISVNLPSLWMQDLGTLFVMYSVRISNSGSRNPVRLLTNAMLVENPLVQRKP